MAAQLHRQSPMHFLHSLSLGRSPSHALTHLDSATPFHRHTARHRSTGRQPGHAHSNRFAMHSLHSRFADSDGHAMQEEENKDKGIMRTSMNNMLV
ncbi:hypothetical protein QJS04_geneDACA005219 [Acorus gramineus]|uniref:Uncharacterized protein n=1 Tax=Acorus gramineus TaxID=55184 RepID=A0AAV9AVC0_ACOGR|nr:hypothetical protein QJS04_geneDACA005219 [Acorus gramineus]